eukprot:TRINITY_DN3206_c0_g1_i3.p1 TRINITY_DN3206_c0_g1~~TRINITY_DN3206_c0_g1_i3.p1  ORF type:complete len:358 (+),score=56.83 TRINITY_DN3206_c0_g1_i3:266-1339(+)
MALSNDPSSRTYGLQFLKWISILNGKFLLDYSSELTVPGGAMDTLLEIAATSKDIKERNTSLAALNAICLRSYSCQAVENNAEYLLKVVEKGFEHPITEENAMKLLSTITYSEKASDLFMNRRDLLNKAVRISIGHKKLLHELTKLVAGLSYNVRSANLIAQNNKLLDIMDQLFQKGSTHEKGNIDIIAVNLKKLTDLKNEKMLSIAEKSQSTLLHPFNKILLTEHFFAFSGAAIYSAVRTFVEHSRRGRPHPLPVVLNYFLVGGLLAMSGRVGYSISQELMANYIKSDYSIQLLGATNLFFVMSLSNYWFNRQFKYYLLPLLFGIFAVPYTIPRHPPPHYLKTPPPTLDTTKPLEQ